VIVISSLGGCFDDSKCVWNGDLIMIWRGKEDIANPIALIVGCKYLKFHVLYIRSILWWTQE
jgi:hypothetical protein